MNLYQHFRDEIVRIVEDLAASGELPGPLDTARVAVEPPREAGHGDITTNAAMVLSKPTGLKPHDLAAVLAERLKRVDAVSKTEIAGPGFINLSLEPGFWHRRLKEIVETGPAYGDAVMLAWCRCLLVVGVGVEGSAGARDHTLRAALFE